MGIKDWVLSQLVSKSVVSSRLLSGGDRYSDEEPLNEEFSNQGITLSLPLIIHGCKIEHSYFLNAPLIGTDFNACYSQILVPVCSPCMIIKFGIKRYLLLVPSLFCSKFSI